MANAIAIAVSPITRLDLERESRRQRELDGATNERILKAGNHFDTSAVGTQRVTETTFDWMAHRKMITFRQHEAGERFRLNAFVARAEPTVGSVDWNASPGDFGPVTPSMFTAQAIADARQKYRADVAAVGPHLMPILDAVLIAEWPLSRAGRVVCGYRDKRAAIAAAAALLRVALDVLGDHYRLRTQKPKASYWRAPGMKLVDMGVVELPKPEMRQRRQKEGSAQ